MSELSKRESQVLSFMRKYQAANDNMPSIRQIMAKLGMNYPNAVTHHLNGLVRKGQIERVVRGKNTFRFSRKTPKKP